MLHFCCDVRGRHPGLVTYMDVGNATVLQEQSQLWGPLKECPPMPVCSIGYRVKPGMTPVMFSPSVSIPILFDILEQLFRSKRKHRIAIRSSATKRRAGSIRTTSSTKFDADIDRVLHLDLDTRQG